MIGRPRSPGPSGNRDRQDGSFHAPTAPGASPILQRRCPSALILVPTRELAIQVGEAVTRYGKELRISVLPVYGGQAIGTQLHALKRGVDVVVATPGRALDHIRRKTLHLKTIKWSCWTRPMRCLDMGFAEDLDAILEQTPKERQTALFSATMPLRIASIAKRHLKEPVEIRIAKEPLKAEARSARAPNGLHRRQTAQGGSTGSHSGHGGSKVGPRVLPHALSKSMNSRPC